MTKSKRTETGSGLAEVLAQIAAVIVAIGGLLVVLHQVGWLGTPSEKAAPSDSQHRTVSSPPPATASSPSQPTATLSPSDEGADSATKQKPIDRACVREAMRWVAQLHDEGRITLVCDRNQAPYPAPGQKIERTLTYPTSLNSNPDYVINGLPEIISGEISEQGNAGYDSIPEGVAYGTAGRTVAHDELFSSFTIRYWCTVPELGVNWVKVYYKYKLLYVYHTPEKFFEDLENKCRK